MIIYAQCTQCNVKHSRSPAIRLTGRRWSPFP